MHVLADYGSTVESEVEVFGLIARANDDMHAFSLLAMVIALFETGYLAHGAGLFESSPGHFSSNPAMAMRLADALRRGARCHDDETGTDSIDFLRMDWFAVAHRACDDLRERFHLAPEVGGRRGGRFRRPLESGGISPFQMQSGRALAAPAGGPTTPTACPSERSRLEEAQDRQHPPVVRLRHRQVELGEDVGDVLLDRALGDDQRRRRWPRWTGPRP